MDCLTAIDRTSIQARIVTIVACVSVCVIIFISSTVAAQTRTQIDAVVLDEMAKQNIVGMAVAIVRNGKLYYARGYGHEDLARTQPVTSATTFRWGSISKTLTATAVLQLDEDSEHFDLNDRVTKHVSYWPRQGGKNDIRIWHLLSNRSGIIHYKKRKNCPGNLFPAYYRSEHPSKHYNARQSVAVFADERLCFEPGTAYKYSTFGYSLLGSAIEGASGTSYATWVNNRIRKPLAMTSLRQATGKNHGFKQRCHVLEPVASGNSAWKLPGGGWESNILDLARFANGLLQGSLLDNTRSLWTTVAGNPGYGFGVKYNADRSEVWHEGKQDDGRALLYLYPDSADQLGIVLMINGTHSIPLRISRQVANLFGRQHGASNTPVVRECDDVCAGRFSGLWRQGDTDVLLRRGYSYEDFVAEWHFLRQAGYYCDDFEPYVITNRVYWDAVFRKGSVGNVISNQLDADTLIQYLAEQSGNGYQPVDIETYVLDGRRYWAGLFRPGTPRHALHLDLSSEALIKLNNDLARRNYRLVDAEAYNNGDSLYWAGIWQSGQGGLLDININAPDVDQLKRQRLDAGYRLIDIENYDYRGRQLWAGSWVKQRARQKLVHNAAFCDSESFQEFHFRPGITSLHNRWREQGFELVDWEADDLY